VKLTKSWISAFGLLAIVGCGDNDAPITFEEFEALAFVEPDTGVYIYNGDELAEDQQQLRAAYESYVDTYLLSKGFGEGKQGLAVNRVGGNDDKWSSATAGNLTYCISNTSFSNSRYNSVVNAMNSATGDWEGAADVNFVHSSGQDGNCTRSNNNVVFNVRQVTTNQYLARAFFPSSSRRNREILIASSAFGNISPWTLTGVLRHELGHALGFRHEHTRPQAGVCFEDNNWRSLTNYDSSSVMHYPQCNGTQNGDLTLTNLDRTGAGILYP
jgi:serralysin